MTVEERATETLIFVGLLKSTLEQATYLTNELKFKQKQEFNILVRNGDNFLKTIETKLTENESTFLEGITDCYHNINLEIRKNLNK